MAPNDEVLASIDAKLSGVLVLVLDAYLRQTGVARPKPRSIDKMLADAGLPAPTIAKLLGKTNRAVNKQLQAERARRSQPSRAKESRGPRSGKRKGTT